MSIFEYDEEKHMRNVRLQGEEYGREIGEEIGEKRGREIGEKYGRKMGEKTGENRLGQLVTVLMNEGKMEEAALVASDAEVRKEYYKKYHLTDVE